MDGTQRVSLEEMNWGDFTKAAVLSPAGASVMQAFSQVGAIKRENSSDFMDFIFTRIAFVDPLLANAARFPARIVTTIVVLVVNICDERGTTNHFMRQLSSLAATVAAIALSIVGIISPESAFQAYLAGLAHFSGTESQCLRVVDGAALIADATVTQSANLVYLGATIVNA